MQPRSTELMKIAAQPILRRTALCCAVLVVGLAGAARLGWLLGWSRPVTLLSHSAAMARSSTLAFVLLGVALWITARSSQARRPLWVARMAAGLVTLLFVLRLGEFLTG